MIWSYRVEDGRGLKPPINAVVFVVSNPKGTDMPNVYATCKRAREFCDGMNESRHLR